MPTRASWLVIGGPIAGYTFDLYREVQRITPVSVRFVHAPLPSAGGLAHETFTDPDFAELRWSGASVWAIARFIREPRPDVVFLYGTEAKVALGLAMTALPASVPIIFASDVNVAALAARPVELLTRRLAYEIVFRRASGALSLGGSNAMALRLLGARPIHEVPHYTVDYEALDEARRIDDGSLLLPSDRLTIVIVARLATEKNLGIALRAVGEDSFLRERVRLLLVGEGPLRETLTEVIAAYPEMDARLLGAIPRSRVGAVMARADALLLPSTYEPWGIVVCEALGMGVPVIATPAVGAAVSLAGSTQAVLVTDSADIEGVRAGLRRFVERSAQMREAAQAVAPEVRERYGRKAVAKRLVALVKRLSSLDSRPTAGTSPA